MIYLDNAATSFPKPHRVAREVLRCMQSYGGNPGRGSHALSLAAAEKIFECREALAAFFGSPNPENVIFTINTTMSLNLVIKGALKAGDHVLLSDMEHNAVFRPIYKLAKAGVITYDVFSTFPTDPTRTAVDICASVLQKLRPNTRMLICAHASNICSACLPLRELGALCRKKGILFVVDAAQSAGHLPIDICEMQIDALCVPGHKGLWGPQGCGALILRDGLVLDTLLEGGSGYHSLDGNMPNEAPERFEAGTLPTPAIAGLLEGVREVRRLGVEHIHFYETHLVDRLCERLSQMPRIKLWAAHHRGNVLLFSIDDIPSERVGALLNERGFCVRAGFHCAALAHATLGTPSSGAVRVSPSLFNTLEQIDTFADAVAALP